MTEPDKTDHWASLASNLGAEPAPEVPKREFSAETPETGAPGQAAGAAPPTPIFRPAGKPAPAPRRPARPSAWDQLAGDLGIAPPPPPPAPLAAIAPSPAVEPMEVVVAAEVPNVIVEAELAEVIAEAELALPVWDELEPSATEPESFEPQEALDIMDETADEFGDDVSEEASATTESATGEPATEEPRSRRRRRRRGRGRGREEAPSAEARTANEFGDELADDEGVVSESVEGDIEDAANEPAGEATLEGERTERRGRRRRRGRGRPRDQIRDEQTGGEESAVDDDEFDFEGAEEDATLDAEPLGERDFDDDEEHDGEHDFEDDEEHDEDAVDSPRIGFRNIPTWQDAIGVMIAKNMESRSRNPGGSRGPSGRGGRGGAGRGRGRRPDRR